MAKKDVEYLKAATQWQKTHHVTGTTKTSALKTPKSGYVLKVDRITITNKETGAVTYSFYDGTASTSTIDLIVSGESTEQFTFNGAEFKTDIRLEVSSYSSGGTVFIEGYEE